MVIKSSKLTADPLAFILNTFAPLLRSSFMTVMSSAKDTVSNPGTQGQVATSVQTSCTVGSPHQVSAVNNSIVSWHQINRPWGGQHKSAGSSNGTKITEGMDPSKITIYTLLILKVTGDAGPPARNVLSLHSAIAPKYLEFFSHGLCRSSYCSRVEMLITHISWTMDETEYRQRALEQHWLHV